MATAMAPLTRNLIAQCVQQRDGRLFNCPPVVTQFSPHQSYASSSMVFNFPVARTQSATLHFPSAPRQLFNWILKKIKKKITTAFLSNRILKSP